MHRRSVIMVSPQDLMQEKDLTYLELPPDEQKLTKRPDTNMISDKDRIATSKAPQLDRKELKKILDSARPGADQVLAGPVAARCAGARSARARKPRRHSPRRSHRRIRTRPRACKPHPRNVPRQISTPARCPRDRPSNRRLARPCPIVADTAAITATTAWAKGSKAAKRSDRWMS